MASCMARHHNIPTFWIMAEPFRQKQKKRTFGLSITLNHAQDQHFCWLDTQKEMHTFCLSLKVQLLIRYKNIKFTAFCVRRSLSFRWCLWNKTVCETCKRMAEFRSVVSWKRKMLSSWLCYISSIRKLLPDENKNRFNVVNKKLRKQLKYEWKLCVSEFQFVFWSFGKNLEALNYKQRFIGIDHVH